MSPRAFAFLLVPVALLSGSAAHAFCRTTTCTPPADFIPSGNTCEPAGWAAECAALSPPNTDAPLWWSNACVGYDVQQNAGKSVSFDQADAAWTAAFQAWSTSTCTGGGMPSIQGRDLGPVACSEVGYQQEAANQHVLVFRDDGWPYQTAQEIASGQKSLTIALTTVNFDKNTGEIFDADIEINSGQHSVIVTDTPFQDTFDLQVVLTHETGHFLGLAHSSDSSAVMFPSDEGSDTKKRMLAADDVSAICAVYPADGSRSVATSVAPSGKVQEGSCDPTPRHGFSSACATPQKSGCSSSPGPAGGAGGALVCLVALAATFSRRARIRP